jgi:hypothetical protein
VRKAAGRHSAVFIGELQWWIRSTFRANGNHQDKWSLYGPRHSTARPGAPELQINPLMSSLRRDPRYAELVISGTGPWENIEVKLFYVDAWLQGHVRRGQPIGTTQDLSPRYPGITNHVHLEVRQFEVIMNPAHFFSSCF